MAARQVGQLREAHRARGPAGGRNISTKKHHDAAAESSKKKTYIQRSDGTTAASRL